MLYSAGSGNDAICVRQSGEDYILIEFGPPVLDLELRFRVHALMQALDAQRLSAIIDLTPGIRSLAGSLRFARALASEAARSSCSARGQGLPALEDLEVPSRIVHLPLSWDDPATRLAIEKYMQSVRADAPWCPSNIEFIRRINGLDSIEDVKRIVFDASYLVMGPRRCLSRRAGGDAARSAPSARDDEVQPRAHVDARECRGHRRRVSVRVSAWKGRAAISSSVAPCRCGDRYRQTADFAEGKQWLLRFFDQIRFYPVSAEELLKMREDFPQGRFALRVEKTTLKLGDQRRFLAENAASIASFKARQQRSFEEERERWKQSRHGRHGCRACCQWGTCWKSAEVPGGCIAVGSPVTGSIWRVSASPGARVAAGETLVVVEAMKMEVPIHAEQAAEVVEVRCARGRTVSAGETVLVLRPLG